MADDGDLRRLIAVLARAMGIPEGFGGTRAPVPHSLGRVFPDTPGIIQVDSDTPPGPLPVPFERWAAQQEPAGPNGQQAVPRPRWSMSALGEHRGDDEAPPADTR